MDTVNRLSGLSRLQRQILGVARTVSQYLKRGPHFSSPLGLYAIFEIKPDICLEHSRFSRSKQTASAQASISRAIRRLRERGLMVRFEPVHLSGEGWGWNLSGEVQGVEPIAVRELDAALRFFEMQHVLYRWAKDDRGQWRGERWSKQPEYRNGAGYSFSRMRDDFEALRR